jgi:hypothetical protein
MTMNENHLFEEMGLTHTNEEEIEQLFSSELNEFLKTQTFVQGFEDHQEEGE